jgi:aminoglycoside phosphotransferase (APT) family kinase protein
VSDELDGQLRALVASVYADDGVVVEGLTRLTGGASRETWAFDVRRSDGSVTELILRRGMPREARAGAALEARAISMAGEAGVPEPQIVFHSDDPAVLGAPCIVMERVAGETLARRILRDDTYAQARPRLAGQCGEILARIHALDARELGLDLDAPEDQLESLAGVLAGFEEKRPALELGLRWLDTHRPPPTPPTVVHGDFRLGNLMIGPDGIRAVLDWELLHAGDPMEDLGYLSVRAWRFGGPHPVGGFGSYDELLDGYERVAGCRPDLDAVRWWELYGTVWWGVMCMAQASRHLGGVTRSVELAAIGRRTAEQEYDTLRIIEQQLAATAT